MAWYDDFSGDQFKFRVPVAVDYTGWTSGAQDWSLNLGNYKSFDHFWSNVLASGNDVRVCEADGFTKSTFDLDSFNTTNRVGTCQVQSFTPTAAGTWLFWGYWKYTGTPSSDETTFTASGPASAYIDRTNPLEGLDPSYILEVEPERHGATEPSRRLAKSADETVYLYWRFQGLKRVSRGANKRASFEEVKYVSYVVVNSADATQLAMADGSATRFLVDSNGDFWIRILVKAGTSGTDYTVKLTVVTTEARTLNPRCEVQVFDVIND